MARARQAPTDSTSLLMTVGECATALGVSEETITALVDSGRWIGSHKAGRKYVISRAAFNRLYRDGIVAEPEQQRHPFLRRIDLAS